VDGGGVEVRRDAMPGLRGAAVIMSLARKCGPCICVDASSCEERVSVAIRLQIRIHRCRRA
jgi:hypothetical protein